MDETRYQTIYARQPGAVAAPTAGLHFDENMLNALRNMGVVIAYVTLHVGLGTFQPVRVENIADHKMHREIFHVPAETVEAIGRAKAEGRAVIGRGHHSLRALEAAAAAGGVGRGREHLCPQGETDIFITPGYRFRVVERLLTNFHLPRSTLLMLVCRVWRVGKYSHAYQHAISRALPIFQLWRRHADCEGIIVSPPSRFDASTLNAMVVLVSRRGRVRWFHKQGPDLTQSDTSKHITKIVLTSAHDSI